MYFNFYKNFYKFTKQKLYDVYLDYVYTKIIFSSKFKKTTYSLKDKKILDIYLSLKTKGIINYKIDYITEYLMEPYIRISKAKGFNHDNKQNPSVSIPIVHGENSLVEKILSDKNLTFIIKSYLGHDAILDNISLNVTFLGDEERVVSEKLHYDNVGKRLKMFIYLNSTNKISTDYALSTNNLKHTKYSTNASRASQKIIKKYQNLIKTFLPRKGQSILFDTNGFHKGNYYLKNYDPLSEKDYYRAIIKFEFSSKEKSNKFFKKNSINAKEIIGPRQTFFSETFDVDSCEMIDKAYLAKVGNFYFYDQGYKGNH